MPRKREEQLKEITGQLEQGGKDPFISENYTEELKTMSRPGLKEENAEQEHAEQEHLSKKYLFSSSQDRKRNLDCKKAIEDTIRKHFDGMHLAHDAAKGVLEEYGTERVAFILANTVQYLEHDGRISVGNKAWAKGYGIPENIGREREPNADCVVNSHPAVLDGFIGLARDRIRELETEDPVHGFDHGAMEAIGDLDSRDVEIAYQTEKGYFSIQTITDGFDYTFYGRDFQEIDGGVYDNPDIPISEAMEAILSDEGIQMSACKVVDYEELQEKVERAAQEKLQKAQAAEYKKLMLISDMAEPEPALNGQSRAGIEETVLCYVQAQIDEMGLSEDVKLLGARVYGSRSRKGLYHEDSDVDVAVSYSGNLKEDVFFNELHGGDLEIAGIPVDINPISVEKTGTLEEFLESAEKNLDEKQVSQQPMSGKAEERRDALIADKGIYGGSKKQSVLNALRERQARIKAQGQKVQAKKEELEF